MIISSKKIMRQASKRMRQAVREQLQIVADGVRGALILEAGGEDGVIIPGSAAERRVRRRARIAVERMFLGPDGFAFAEDGVTAQSPYALILNREIVRVTAEIIYAHRDWLQKHIPDDVFQFLSTAISRPVSVREQENPFLRRDDESDEAYRARLKNLRIFEPNPSAQYEPAHTWVDPNGYRLSDRIWNTGNETRRKLDALLTDQIAQGKSAREISSFAERWLLPGRRNIRTNKPYGSNGSFDAMRLGRTEISHAGNQAAYIAAANNPYVEGIDIARSPFGDPNCKICPQHATIGLGGERLRDPYEVGGARLSPYHPHCLCAVLSVVMDVQTVTMQLRAVMEDARREYLLPVMTPAQADAFIVDLIGPILARLLLQLA